MNYNIIKKCIVIITLFIILGIAFMLPSKLSNYQDLKRINIINKINYTEKSTMPELQYIDRLKMVNNLVLKNNKYYSLDSNIVITINDSILVKNEMSLEQVISYINSQIVEFKNTYTYINNNLDYYKSTIESKYIRLIDKNNPQNSMGLWDITFKNNINDYLNIVVDSLNGKVYSIYLLSSNNLDIPVFDYKKIWQEYREYLNLNNIFDKEILTDNDKKRIYLEADTNLFRLSYFQSIK